MNEINQINDEPVRKSRILLVDDEPGDKMICECSGSNGFNVPNF